MGFSEKIKTEVKKKADFRCCRCHDIGIDVHHIKPKKGHGSDDVSNAAPLCQNCHNQFGSNPIKRTEITKMRDAWYEKVEKMYSGQVSHDPESHRKIDEKLNKIEKGFEKGFEELKGELISYIGHMINNLTPANAQYIASGLVNIATASSNIKLGGLAQTWYAPAGPPIIKSVITEDRRSLSNGTEEFYKK